MGTVNNCLHYRPAYLCYIPLIYMFHLLYKYIIIEKANKYLSIYDRQFGIRHELRQRLLV